MLGDFGCPITNAVKLYEDDLGTVACTSGVHGLRKTNHIGICYHCLCDAVDAGTVEVVPTPSVVNKANELTKVLSKIAFVTFRADMSVFVGSSVDPRAIEETRLSVWLRLCIVRVQWRRLTGHRAIRDGSLMWFCQTIILLQYKSYGRHSFYMCFSSIYAAHIVSFGKMDWHNKIKNKVSLEQSYTFPARAKTETITSSPTRHYLHLFASATSSDRWYGMMYSVSSLDFRCGLIRIVGS